MDTKYTGEEEAHVVRVRYFILQSLRKNEKKSLFKPVERTRVYENVWQLIPCFFNSNSSRNMIDNIEEFKRRRNGHKLLLITVIISVIMNGRKRWENIICGQGVFFFRLTRAFRRLFVMQIISF